MPSTPFSRTFHVRWGDMDFNAHMRNTAYLDTAVDVRLMYFAENGFPSSEFERLRLGPVTITPELAGTAPTPPASGCAATSSARTAPWPPSSPPPPAAGSTSPSAGWWSRPRPSRIS